MGQPATLVIDIETVGQEPELIPSRAREILLDSGTEEDRLKILESLGLDPCTGKIICIGVHWLELDRSRAYCQPDERELLANFWSDIGQIRPQRFVTFNGKSFDFPYINIRSAIMARPSLLTFSILGDSPEDRKIERGVGRGSGYRPDPACAGDGR